MGGGGGINFHLKGATTQPKMLEMADIASYEGFKRMESLLKKAFGGHYHKEVQIILDPDRMLEGIHMDYFTNNNVLKTREVLLVGCDPTHSILGPWYREKDSTVPLIDKFKAGISKERIRAVSVTFILYYCQF